MMKFALSSLFLLLASHAAVADWRDDSGFTQLAAEYGVSLPTGAGMAVLQCEAATTTGNPGAYLPQAGESSPITGEGEFAGCTIYAESGLEGFASASGHAREVAGFFFGNSSLTPDVNAAHCFEADRFIAGLDTQTPPPTVIGSVQNHSYVGSTGSNTEDEQLLRRYDVMASLQNTVACVPLNNGSGTSVPQLPSSTYNGICVGLRNGDHSRGGTSVDGAGRMKPDLVVNLGFTSLATPAVGSSAVLLRQRLQALAPAYDQPLVVKALLLAGASKDVLPQWRRATDTAPYDAVYGAGELNIRNSYHLLEAGRQAAHTTTEVTTSGWDLAATATSTSEPRWYFFTIPEGRWADTFSVALTWNRVLTVSTGQLYESDLPVLQLALHASNGAVPYGAAISQSVSQVDNVQHLFLRNLPAGQYGLRISNGPGTEAVTPYALAWQADLGQGLQTTVIPETDKVKIQASHLDPYLTYTVQRSANLTTWDNVGTFRPADTIPATTYTWEDLAPLTDRGFYRVRWEGLRP